MTDKITITLEDTPYEITAPLTLGQAIDLRVAVALPDLPDPQESARRGYQRSLDIIATALKAEHPEATVEWMLTRRITMDEIGTAVTAILEMAGLARKKDDKPGEEQAPAADPPGPQATA